MKRADFVVERDGYSTRTKSFYMGKDDNNSFFFQFEDDLAERMDDPASFNVSYDLEKDMEDLGFSLSLDVGYSDLTEEELLEELDKVKVEVFQQMYGVEKK